MKFFIPILYIPIWRDSYQHGIVALADRHGFTFQYGEIHTSILQALLDLKSTFTFQYGEIHTAVLPPFYA